MKHMLVMRKTEGFALPTILIASVIMLIVLMSAVTAVSSITGGINSQYYNQLAREAAESGLASAETCLRVSNYTPTWSNANPLRPDTNCSGTVQGGYAKYVIDTPNVRTTFTVPQPEVGVASALRIASTGTVELLRTSNPNSPWRTFTVTVGKNSRYNDLPQIAGGAGWKETDHNGYMLSGTGILYGWGSNQSNQLGDAALGLPTYVTTPIKIAYPSGVTRAKRVFNSGQGASILCILATHNTLGDQVYCRGYGGFSGPTWARFGLPGALTALDMSVNGYGADSACVIASDNQAYCAGINDRGGLGNGINNGAYVPMNAPTRFRLDLANPAPVGGTPLPLTAKKVFNQDSFTCVIASDDRVYCAGDNNWGQLGQGTHTFDVWVGKSTPGRALVPGNPAIRDISLPYHGGYDGVFYVTEFKEVFMSGHNANGTANDGAFSGSCPPIGGGSNCYNIPRSISSQGFDKIISIGNRGDDVHGFCLIANVETPINSGLWCLGQNDYGQLGAGDCVDRAWYYGAANLGAGVVASSAAMNLESKYQMNSMMIITTAGDVFAAGDNTYGKLGTNGPLQACNGTFAKVQLPAGVKAVAMANGDEYTAYILGDNGKLYSMGRNHNGQLGNGTMTDSKVPVEVKIPRQETIF